MSETSDTRVRLLDAALECIDRWGLAKTSLEDIANQAGLSRATVYRYFPGGRDQVISETITWEVGRFFSRIGEEISDLPDLEAKLVRGLEYGHQTILEHRLLQQVLTSEPEEFLEELSETTPLVHDVVCAYLADLLRHEPLREGIDIDMAADYLARLFFSYLGSQGHWDLTDPGQVQRLVRTQFLPGIVRSA